jgi:two-component sensor histidine kinase
MSNALKHAFIHSESGVITLQLTIDDNKLITLIVADDGIGIGNSLNAHHNQDTDANQGLPLSTDYQAVNQKILRQANPKLSQLYKSRRSLGFKLIDNLVRQLKARVNCTTEGGTKFEFQFIELNYEKRI